MKSVLLFLIVLLFSPFAMSQQPDDNKREETYFDYLMLAANHYWNIGNMEGYIMVFTEVEVVSPGFSSSFNIALATYRLGEYTTAMNKLSWLEKRYSLTANQLQRVQELRQQIEAHFRDYHGLSYLATQRSACMTHGSVCMRQITEATEIQPFVTNASVLENDPMLLVGASADSPQQLLRKFEHKLLL